jgi:hypothetical protein
MALRQARIQDSACEHEICPGEAMKTIKNPLYRPFAWVALAASLLAVAAFAGVATVVPAVGSDPSFEIVQVDGMRCVVDRDADTFVSRADGQPDCEPMVELPSR